MSHPPTHTPTTPPGPRSSNKALPSPLRPNSAPQPSGSPRPIITPTASPRPATGSATSPATPPPERSKTRAVDLLRKHYGLSVTPPTPSGRPMDPMDLGQRSSRNIPLPVNNAADSPAFDAKVYYDQLITTAPLTTLLKKENDLLTGELSSNIIAYSRSDMSSGLDIRQLEGERQSLVYNHHHELIDATDTISAVSRLVAWWSSSSYVRHR